MAICVQSIAQYLHICIAHIVNSRSLRDTPLSLNELYLAPDALLFLSVVRCEDTLWVGHSLELVLLAVKPVFDERPLRPAHDESKLGSARGEGVSAQDYSDWVFA